MALVGAIVWDLKVALAIVIGGAISSLWTIYMALTLFKHGLSFGVRMSAASFVLAWVIKLGLTIGLLVIAFRSRLFAPLGLLVGLFGAMLAYWAWFVWRGRHAGNANGK